jgi:outer membrane murein-binding lipoprotein Lpp
LPTFTNDQWVVVALVFLLGLVIGMILMAGGKWKRRYREEGARVRELEAENARLRKESGEMDSLRHAAARDEARRRVDEPGPL